MVWIPIPNRHVFGYLREYLNRFPFAHFPLSCACLEKRSQQSHVHGHVEKRRLVQDAVTPSEGVGGGGESAVGIRSTRTAGVPWAWAYDRGRISSFSTSTTMHAAMVPYGASSAIDCVMLVHLGFLRALDRCADNSASSSLRYPFISSVTAAPRFGSNLPHDRRARHGVGLVIDRVAFSVGPMELAESNGREAQIEHPAQSPLETT